MTKKIIFLCGSHPRHLFVAKQLLLKNMLKAVVIEKRENFIPSPPDSLDKIDKENFVLHFRKRAESESKFFKDIGIHDIKNIPLLVVETPELNSDKVCDFVKKHKADLLLTYGVHKIEEKILSVHELNFNVHGGLSPWFRGNTTLFWPFYMLRPNWAGMTIHKLTEKLDGGAILHHSIPKLELGDSMHDVANKAVIKVTEDLIGILSEYDKGKELICHEQKKAGKLFISDDWSPQTLRVIYNLFDDKIVDLFLDGKLEKKYLKTINFFSDSE